MSRIAGDIEKGDDLFFGDHHFFRQHNTISNVMGHYFMAAFTQYLKKNPRYTCKSSMAYSLINNGLLQGWAKFSTEEPHAEMYNYGRATNSIWSVNKHNDT